MDNCVRCGWSQFDEENGLFYCGKCQLQRVGRIEEVFDEDNVDFSRIFTREVKDKKVKRKAEKRFDQDNDLWNTIQAFDIILKKQYEILVNELKIDNELHVYFNAIWYSYLEISEQLHFLDTSKIKNSKEKPKVHIFSSKRDISLVESGFKSLPEANYNSRKTNNERRYRLGNKIIEVNKYSDNNNNQPKTTTNILSHDIFANKPQTLKLLHKRSTYRMTKEIKNQVYSFHENITNEQLYNEETDMDEGDCIDDTHNNNEKLDDKMVSSEKKSFSKRVKNEANVSKLTRNILKDLPSKYLSGSRPLNEFVLPVMSLPKTLAIINLSLRLLNVIIYSSDLVHWTMQGHLPYFNTLSCLPEDWKIIPIDRQKFTSFRMPKVGNINILSAKIAKFIGIQELPPFDFKGTVRRYVKDLNLPSVITEMVYKQFMITSNLDFTKKCKNCFEKGSKIEKVETYSLIAIIVMLKKLFILDGATEDTISKKAKKFTNNPFIWKEWESHTRLRYNLIQTHYLPVPNQNMREFKDLNVIENYYFKVVHSWRQYERKFEQYKKKGRCKVNLDVIENINSNIIKLENECNIENLDIDLPPISIYHLTSATNFSKERITNKEVRRRLDIDFSDKTLNYVLSLPCYEYSLSNKNEHSITMQLLLEVASFILMIPVKEVESTLITFERMFFKKHFQTKRQLKQHSNLKFAIAINNKRIEMERNLF